MGKARAAVLISFSASRAPRRPDSEVTPPDKAAFACGSMPAKRLVSARRYGCKAGKPVQLMSITFPLVTPVMIGSELPLKVHAGVELAAPAGAAASADSRVRVEANNSKTPRVEAIRWRGIGDSFRGSCGHEWQAFPPPLPQKCGPNGGPRTVVARCTRVSGRQTGPVGNVHLGDGEGLPYIEGPGGMPSDRRKQLHLSGKKMLLPCGDSGDSRSIVRTDAGDRRNRSCSRSRDSGARRKCRPRIGRDECS